MSVCAHIQDYIPKEPRSSRNLWYKFNQPMENIIFHPARRLGFFFHLGAIMILLAAGVYGLYKMAHASLGPAFLLALLPIILAVVLTPTLTYRLYALTSASYTIQRDGIRLQWGLRVEEIPMTSVLWVRPASELLNRLPLPWLYWPGSVVGVRRFPGAGVVEFMAATTRALILVGTPGQIFAISPADRHAFLASFNRLSELGSLTPIAPRTVRPSLWLSRVWAYPAARWLILAGSLLSLALLIWVSIVIPGLDEVNLGFRPDGSPRGPVPTVQLLLLPVLNSLIFLVNLLVGLAYFRQDEKNPLAYLLWGNTVVISALFLLGVFFILKGV